MAERMMIRTACPPSLPRVRTPPRITSKPTRATMYARRGTAETSVMMTTSRWRRWPISWARTARISSWFNCARSPCVTTSSDVATVRQKTKAFGAESPLSQILGVRTPAWRASSSTVWYSHGFVSGVMARRSRIAHRTIAGEMSHWRKMKKRPRPTTIPSAPGNACVWSTKSTIASRTRRKSEKNAKRRTTVNKLPRRRALRLPTKMAIFDLPILRHRFADSRRQAVRPESFDADGSRGPRRCDAHDSGLDGRGRHEAGRLAKGLSHHLPRMHLRAVLRVRGRCDDPLRGHPHADGDQRPTERRPAARLLLEDPRAPIGRLSDARIQTASCAEGALRDRGHDP